MCPKKSLLYKRVGLEIWPEGYKKKIMLILAEHEISSAHMFKMLRNSAFVRLRKA